MIKPIKYLLFKLIYGKINKIILPKKDKDIFIKKVNFGKLINYNLYKIKKGRIFSDTINNTAYLINNSLIKDVSFQLKLKKNLRMVNGKINENFVIKNGTPKFIKKVDGSVFSLLSGGAAKNNYWHWIFDVLPKIGIFKKSRERSPDFYLLPSLKKKYQIDSLYELNIPIKKLLDGEKYKHIKSHKILSVDHPNVFKNNPSTSIQNIPFWIIKWLKKQYVNNNKQKTLFPKKIFINRDEDSHTEKRKLVNNNEVKSFLEKCGFTSVTLSKYEFKKQVKLFNNANFIVGLHGAGFANIVFSKPKTKVLEIKSKSSGNVITNLAKKCSMEYTSYVDRDTKSINNQDSHTKVDIEKLKKLIFSLEQRRKH